MNTTLKHFTFLGVIASLGLFGCTTVDPYSNQPKTSQTAKGAGIGAASGAALGAILGGHGDRVEGALLGAGIGALAGGAIGHNMDSQEAELRRKLEVAGVQVARQGDLIALNLPSHVNFVKNSFALSQEFKRMLNGVAEVVLQYNSNILIEGHASADEGQKSELSKQRAESVANYLFARGVSRAHMGTMGYGSSKSISTLNEENRRVEITISPVRG